MSDATQADTAAESTETTTDQAAETAQTDTVDAVTPADVEKWKALAQKHEKRAKDNAAAAKELADLKLSAMTEQEQAVERARLEARTEALREIGTERVDDAFRVALAGRPVDDDALLEGLDKAAFLAEDGQPDRSRIAAWVDRIAPKPNADTPVAFDLGQGARGGDLPLGSDPLLASLKHAIGAS